MVRIKVDLPAPLGPSRPNMPFGMSSDHVVQGLHAVGVGLGQVLDRQHGGPRNMEVRNRHKLGQVTPPGQ